MRRMAYIVATCVIALSGDALITSAPAHADAFGTQYPDTPVLRCTVTVHDGQTWLDDCDLYDD